MKCKKCGHEKISKLKKMTLLGDLLANNGVYYQPYRCKRCKFEWKEKKYSKKYIKMLKKEHRCA